METGDPFYPIATAPCECQKLIKIKRLLKSSGLDETKTFENFNPRPLQKQMYDQAVEYVQNYHEIKNSRSNGMALMGRVGNGKTHILNAIGNELIKQGIQVVFVYTPDLMEELRLAQFDNNEGLTKKIELIKNAEVVIFDDLAKEKVKEWGQMQYDKIINHRYVHKLPTLYSTNSSISQLEDKLGEAATDRLMAMTKERIINCTDSSYRMME